MPLPLAGPWRAGPACGAASRRHHPGRGWRRPAAAPQCLCLCVIPITRPRRWWRREGRGCGSGQQRSCVRSMGLDKWRIRAGRTHMHAIAKLHCCAREEHHRPVKNTTTTYRRGIANKAHPEHHNIQERNRQ
eukprot:354850-Chlamydomonas_euryale.AAC.2